MDAVFCRNEPQETRVLARSVCVFATAGSLSSVGALVAQTLISVCTEPVVLSAQVRPGASL